MERWLSELGAITALLAVVAVVVLRLPKIDVGHTPAYRRRRFGNWFPVGLTYAFLYMGRYNLNACVGHLYTTEQFSKVQGVGALVYGVSFVLNGPLTDRWGGRRTIIIAAVGAAAANLATAFVVRSNLVGGEFGKELWAGHVPLFALLFAVNMYFQSFGAVSIVKVNSAWFHLRERGTFGGVFGILISLGLYFAFDVCALLRKEQGTVAVFAVPACILLACAVACATTVRDTPGEAGYPDFDLGDASAAAGAPRAPLLTIVTAMAKNPAIVTIALIEFCSGYLRNGILQYYKPFATAVLRAKGDFVYNHWGMLNCIAGILGGVTAGIISDRLFGSRRGPVAGVLYGLMLVGSLLLIATVNTPFTGWNVVLMTLAIIGVHGMLSGTATMDFGGKQNVGIVVGVIDGFVYLGISLNSFLFGRILPKPPLDADPANWWRWPVGLSGAAVVGLLLSLRVWNSRPDRSGAKGETSRATAL